MVFHIYSDFFLSLNIASMYVTILHSVSKSVFKLLHLTHVPFADKVQHNHYKAYVFY